MRLNQTYLLVLSVWVLVTTAGCSSNPKIKPNANLSGNEQITANYYQSLLTSEPANHSLLTLFLNRMPKGGDIHHHYSGTIYAETYLAWVDKKGWAIDSCSFRIVQQPSSYRSDGSDCKAMSVEQLLNDSEKLARLLTLWSDKDYDNHFHLQPPPDSNFFNTFGYFSPISGEYSDIGLRIIRERAIKENVQYIETMYKMVDVQSGEFFSESLANQLNEQLLSVKSQKELDDILNEIRLAYNANPNYQKQLDAYVSKLTEAHQGIDDELFTMRYQTYAVRVLPPLQVFTNLLAGHQVVEISPLLVGVNIVAPENNPVALRDYTLHMMMYNYLQRHYPSVQRALHAGELTLGLVPPEALTFHIHEALDIAKAQRIGHGIDVVYEDNPTALIEKLKQQAVVEINLTSNEFILGVKGNEHPYLTYKAFGVPMIISTDDSGVSRNNLSNEYLLLAQRYRPSYSELKRLVYNGIHYSFLSDVEKARIKKQLDESFRAFEFEVANWQRLQSGNE